MSDNTHTEISIKTESWQSTCGHIFYFLLVSLVISAIFQGIFLVATGHSFNEPFALTEIDLVVMAVISSAIAIILIRSFVKISPTLKEFGIGLSINGRVKDFFIGTLVGGTIMTIGFFLLSMMGEVTLVTVNLSYSDMVLSMIGF